RENTVEVFCSRKSRAALPWGLADRSGAEKISRAELEQRRPSKGTNRHERGQSARGYSDDLRYRQGPRSADRLRTRRRGQYRRFRAGDRPSSANLCPDWWPPSFRGKRENARVDGGETELVWGRQSPWGALHWCRNGLPIPPRSWPRSVARRRRRRGGHVRVRPRH